MKILIKLEELAQFLFSIYLFSLLPYAWWAFPLFILAPDVSLLGLLAGKRVGAVTYNLVHHKALALTVYVLGGLLGNPLLSLLGVLLFGHSSFDRMVGFNLMDVGMQVKPVPGSVSQSS
jgi:Domain of unknown function (DUF4260)